MHFIWRIGLINDGAMLLSRNLIFWNSLVEADYLSRAFSLPRPARIAQYEKYPEFEINVRVILTQFDINLAN